MDGGDGKSTCWLLQIGAKDGDDFFNFLVTLFGRDALSADMLAQVSFQNLGHQACNGPTDGCNLLQDLAAVQVLAPFNQALQAVGLTFDAAHAGQQTLLARDSVGHIADSIKVLGWGTLRYWGRVPAEVPKRACISASEQSIMTEFATLLQQGNAWLFVPSAILLGALHGLEPGHSKTMMAAFIVAIRGTLTQAVLLGLSATLSHTAVVWLVALAGLYFGRNWNAEATEPYFQVASAVLIVGVAAWMLWRTWRDQHGHGHHHGHDDSHDHDGPKRVETGRGTVRLEVFETDVPPRFRLHIEKGHAWAAHEVELTTTRLDGAGQTFQFVARDGFLESVDEIPEPHAFEVRLSLGHDDHRHDYDLTFSEHDHTHEGLEVGDLDYQDAHERAHANDIKRRFANREVTTGQIIMFGLTGGLIPCPASITVLLLCLQLKQFTLGAALVLCFSIGLALTMVASGAMAALSVKHMSKRWSGFGEFARKAPYFSGVLILLVGIYVGFEGARHLIS